MLRKLILLVLAISFGYMGLQAQGIFYYQEKGHFEFGPKAGFTTSMLYPDSKNFVGKPGVRFSLTGGFFGRYQLKEKFSLQIDLGYASRGGAFSETGKIRLDYIDLPVVAIYSVRYKFREVPMTFDFLIGLQPSFLIKAENNGITTIDQWNSISGDFVIGGGLPIWRFLFYATTKIALSKTKNSITGLVSPLRSITTEWTVSYRMNGK